MTCSDPPVTYATSRPSGEGRGSTTGPAAGTGTGEPPSVRTTHSAPESAQATTRAAASAAYATTPVEYSRARSRRTRSASGSRPSAAFVVPVVGVTPNATGSINTRSLPPSNTHSRPTGSLPPPVRTKSTRRPSGETPN